MARANVRVLADSSFVLCADFHNMTLRCVLKVTRHCTVYYAALLPRTGPHIASHSVCPSVCLSVRPVIVYFTVEPSYERTSKIEKLVFAYGPVSRMHFSARTEGRISYGHLGRTNSC